MKTGPDSPTVPFKYFQSEMLQFLISKLFFVTRYNARLKKEIIIQIVNLSQVAKAYHFQQPKQMSVQIFLLEILFWDLTLELN